MSTTWWRVTRTRGTCVLICTRITWTARERRSSPYRTCSGWNVETRSGDSPSSQWAEAGALWNYKLIGNQNRIRNRTWTRTKDFWEGDYLTLCLELRTQCWVLGTGYSVLGAWTIRIICMYLNVVTYLIICHCVACSLDFKVSLRDFCNWLIVCWLILLPQRAQRASFRARLSPKLSCPFPDPRSQIPHPIPVPRPNSLSSCLPFNQTKSKRHLRWK